MATTTIYQPTGFIDLLLDAVCAVDVDGRFVFVSAACDRIFGYTPQELVGRPMIDFVAPVDRERTLAAADSEFAAAFRKPLCAQGRQAGHHHVDGAVGKRPAANRRGPRRHRARACRVDPELRCTRFPKPPTRRRDCPTCASAFHRIVDGLLPARNFSVGLDNAGE